MAINLFNHNLTAYKSALEMMDTVGKAAVIHPTGTGKSFIGFKLAEDNPDKAVVWLTPSEYIVKTQVENLKNEGSSELTNITFITYSKLMGMNDEEIESVKADYLVADEFHRSGAEFWGNGVKRFISLHPSTKILGLSATHIRYLDNQRDMAEEMFDGNIASYMTLGEAIVRGILLPPTYVISVYSYQKELERYSTRVDGIQSKAIRNKSQRELDLLRRTLEQAEGLDKTFAKHMKNKSGKYIVFCSNYENMQNMLEMAKDWFADIDKDMHIYKVYTGEQTASKDFNDFKTDNSDHLKLLYCIDMLNEGVHVEDIDGVILFRPTVSPIIYKQQIGRALSANKKKQPIIFDIVNNFESLYSIGTIQEEMKLAISYYRDLGEQDKIVNDSFEIFDEARDCREIFRELERSLSSTWDTYYNAAKEYYDKNSNLNVPKRYVTDEGLTLGAWISTQRKVRNGAAGVLTPAQIHRLDMIGMNWENVQEQRWENGFNHAKEYFNEHGNLDAAAGYICDDGFKLGAWLANNRQQYKNNSVKLSDERAKRLEEIGMVWSKVNALWEKNYIEAAKYYRENGNLDIPVSYVTDEGIKLGMWLNNQKKSRNKLTTEQAERLSLIGMVWENKYNANWNSMYEEAKRYYKTFGDLKVPAAYRTKNGKALGKWIYNQRGNSKISAQRRSLLNEIGMVWNKAAA